MSTNEDWLADAVGMVHDEMRQRGYAARLSRPHELTRAAIKLLRDLDRVYAGREPAKMPCVDVCWVVETGLTLTLQGNSMTATFHAQPRSATWWLTVRDSFGEFYLGESAPLRVPVEVLDRVWCYVTEPAKES